MSDPRPPEPAVPPPLPAPRPPTLDPRPSTPHTPRGLLGGVIRFCLENTLVVAILVLFLVAVGVLVAPFDWDIRQAVKDAVGLDVGEVQRYPVPVDAIPDIGENQQIVFTEWMGRSPQDVEDQITYPLTVSLLGIPHVKTVRSFSFFGFSSIYVIFKDGVDFYWSRSRVLEKLNSLPAGTLPQGVQPALGPDATALGQVFWYTLEGRDENGKPTGGWDLDELRTIQDWYVRYYLLAADGVSEVASVGGFVREYQIDVDPDAMRAYGVSLNDVFNGVRRSNIDVGARTIEINRVEYVIRGLGFIRELSDIEQTVVKVHDNVPVLVKHVAKASLGPAIRRGALDKEGTEAVGGVVVVRYGENPLATIKNVKDKIREIAPGLAKKTLPDGRVSQVTIVPFYDRTGLIYETLGTLSEALYEEILVTIIVVIVMVLHLRSSVLISGLLPLAVLMCFIAMKFFGVDANIVALSGIAIAIGTIVDMGIVVCENILKHLEAAPPDENRLEVVYRAAVEVGSAVVTAIATTVVSFLPVFTMEAAEGKLFKPLAYTKTAALVASVIVALTVIPPFALMLFSGMRSKTLRTAFHVALVAAGLVLGLTVAWWAGAVVAAFGAWHLVQPLLPALARRIILYLANAAAVAAVALLLTEHWMPLGPEKGLTTNAVFVGCLIGGTLGFFQLFRLVYTPMLRFFLAHKLLFLAIPAAVCAFGGYVWLGPRALEGPMNRAPRRLFASRDEVETLLDQELLEERGYLLLWTRAGLSRDAKDVRTEVERLGIGTAPALLESWSRARRLMEDGAKNWGDFNRARRALFASREDIKKLLAKDMLKERPGVLLWTSSSLSIKPKDMKAMLDGFKIKKVDGVLASWSRAKELTDLGRKKWGEPDFIEKKSFATRVKWTLARDWDGRGKEFMPPLDEGSYLFMPTTMPHASIGEALDVIQKQDMAIRAIPEIDMVVGKLGRVESPLDPAPISMIETTISYKPEYMTDKAGRRLSFKYDKAKKDFVRDAQQNLIVDPHGRPYRQWRDHIKKPDDIWDEIVRVTKLPGTTSAPRLQPIAARIVMLQSGMRAPMGVKVKGPDLDTIEKVGLQIEKFLKEVPSVEPAAVFADRIVGKPYVEIDIDRAAIARYGIDVRRVQDVIEVAIGGRKLTTTVMGRERYPVRVRYMRELRDRLETLGRILVPAPDGTQIPLVQLAKINYVRGPQAIKSEDTFLVGYIIFDKKPGYAEVDVVEDCQRYLNQKIESGELEVPAGVSYKFAGSYENQMRAEARLKIILPVAMFVIFIILYFQFRSVFTTFIVFSGIGVAWAGGFLMLWLYAQPWFLNFQVAGVDMRELFQVHPVNLSVAVWVGFLALFGIASDNGVIIATYLRQRFNETTPASVAEVREATVFAAHRRIRPCLMTTATTVLALIPVLTSTGRGSDVMVPMAIPSFGGMTVAVITAFVVPVLYCLVAEVKLVFSSLEPTPADGEPPADENQA